MLPLDSPRWNLLAGAYNAGGSDVVKQLEEIAANNDSEYEELFQNICHQHTVCTLSYAAVPHLVAAAKKTPNSEFRDELLFLAASVCTGHFVGNKAPADIENWYKESVDEARELAIDVLNSAKLSYPSWSLWSIVALSFLDEVAHALESLCVDEEFELTCPECNTDFLLYPKMAQLVIETENHLVVKSGPAEGSKWSGVYNWLSELVAGNPELEKESLFLPSLFGIATCPGCGKEVSLLDYQAIFVYRRARSLGKLQ